jgi:uncharacterized membrane protein
MSDNSIEVDVPAALAYEHYLQFENYPQFLQGLVSAESVTPTRVRWVYSVAGKEGSVEAEIAEDLPQEEVTLRAVDAPDHSWTTSFEELGRNRCKITQHSTGSMTHDDAGLQGAPRAAAGEMAGQMLAGMAASFLTQFKHYLETEVKQPV